MVFFFFFFAFDDLFAIRKFLCAKVFRANESVEINFFLIAAHKRLLRRWEATQGLRRRVNLLLRHRLAAFYGL